MMRLDSKMNRRVLFCAFSVAGGFDGNRERGTSGGGWYAETPPGSDPCPFPYHF